MLRFHPGPQKRWQRGSWPPLPVHATRLWPSQVDDAVVACCTGRQARSPTSGAHACEREGSPREDVVGQMKAPPKRAMPPQDVSYALPSRPVSTYAGASYATRSTRTPLYMLDTAGKILERIICDRLEATTESPGGLSDHQYSFRKGRSTINAIENVIATAREAIAGKRLNRGTKKYCAVVTLDVKNAFNSARWKQSSTPRYTPNAHA
ncbi:unnamed protein product [Trichogramma brassicae]|uniref:Reverse transcriptase domain-containing protein n=1 Tax=Trichogramma brassicae TaxID=86971 RepID=A0A6H5IAJ5_9HYME|nr:unnamed protein product [Trichogramma brassicae]